MSGSLENYSIARDATTYTFSYWAKYSKKIICSYCKDPKKQIRSLSDDLRDNKGLVDQGEKYIYFFFVY